MFPRGDRPPGPGPGPDGAPTGAALAMSVLTLFLGWTVARLARESSRRARERERRAQAEKMEALDVALVNLVLNARDAMGGSGSISVRAFPCDEESGAPTAFIAKPVRFICLTVKDDGPGMTEGGSGSPLG